MKKLISLSVAAMLGFALMAQDTSTNRSNSSSSNSNSQSGNNQSSNSQGSTNQSSYNRDTIPGSNRSQRDTSTMQWSDSSNAGRRSTDSAGSTWNRTDSSLDQRSSASGDTSMSSSNQSSSNQSSTQGNNSSTQGNNSSTQGDATTETMTDRILMRNDSLLLIQNGEATGLDKEYKLQSGAVVNSKGVVKYPSGKSVQLKNGQFIELTPATDSKSDKMSSSSEKTTKSKSSSTTKKGTTGTKSKKSTTTDYNQIKNIIIELIF